MFDRACRFNQFLLGNFGKVMADIPADRITERAAGIGHPPVWVLGHLAAVGEMGQMLLGGEMVHPEWVALFGPGSSDEVPGAEQFAKDELVECIERGYPKLREMLVAAPQARLDAPHEVEILNGTPIETVADIQVHVLTTHFAFHLAQLSVWRRAHGGAPLL